MKTSFITNAYKATVNLNNTLNVGTILLVFAFSSCKKQTVFEGSPYAIKVFNGINNGVNLIGNYNGDRPASFKTAIAVPNRSASANSYYLETSVNAGYFAVPDTMPKDLPIFKQDLNLSESRVNALYLMGNKSEVDQLFLPINLRRYTVGDSTAYITIVNISNGQPVSVNISGKPRGSLVDQLAYKKVSDIIEFPVGAANSNYVIEFTDAVSGTVLANFTLDNSSPAIGYPNTYLYKNISLVLVGKRGDTGIDKITVVRDNHD